MNQIENNLMYQQLDNKTKELVIAIKRTAKHVLNEKANLIEEEFDDSFDMDSEWYSYAMIIDSNPKDTLNLNKQFIDLCIKINLINLLDCNVTFRFESGDLDGI